MSKAGKFRCAPSVSRSFPPHAARMFSIEKILSDLDAIAKSHPAGEFSSAGFEENSAPKVSSSSFKSAAERAQSKGEFRSKAADPPHILR
ncbi:unknown [Coraliomargarita sp. CAG:312]|nr:unknown [Coraliomargarita sp. CAG:312]